MKDFHKIVLVFGLVLFSVISTKGQGLTGKPVILWLKADQGVYEDKNVYLPGSDVAEDGDLVLSWKDQFRVKTNAVTSDHLGSPPIFKTDAINYHSAIEFNGTGNVLNFPASEMS